MALQDIISKIYETKWDYVNDFKINIFLPDGVDNITNKDTKTKNPGLEDFDELDGFNFYIKSFTLPDSVTQPIESFVGGEWIYTTGTKQIKRIDMTFTDYNDFYNFRCFTYIFEGLKDKFPNEQYFKIVVKARNDDGFVIYETDKAILDSISNISFDRTTESQVAEFSVSFKSA